MAGWSDRTQHISGGILMVVFLTQSYAESGAEERRVFQVRGSEWGGKREGYRYLSNVLTVKTCGGVESGG
jgi:hypothetical protein